VTEPRRRRYTAGDWVIIIAAVGGLGVGLINAWQGESRDNKLTEQSETLDTIEHQTNSRLTTQDDKATKQDEIIAVLQAEIQAMKVQKATDDERQTPTAADGSAK
jgi:hypothetical protein